MSLLEHLDRLYNYDNTQEVTVRQEPNRLAFKPGTPLISLDHYLIEATDDSTDNLRPAYNVKTGEALSAKLYEHTTFHVKSHLLLANVQGVCNVLDVKKSNEGVLVFTQQTHGDLHGYLREKKRLSESQAAPLFRQITEMIAHAHYQRIALRDIKLKKFVFTDESRWARVVCAVWGRAVWGVCSVGACSVRGVQCGGVQCVQCRHDTA